MVTTLFENNDLRLSSTGHDYDFVGTIEIKSEKPLTFFFSEQLYPMTDDDGTEYDEYEPAEDETTLADIYSGLKPYNEETGEDEAEDIAQHLLFANDYDHVDFFTQSREDGWKGFLSCPKERG